MYKMHRVGEHMKRVLYIFFCLVFLFAALWSGVNLFTALRSYEVADESYEELQQLVTAPTQSSFPAVENAVETAAPVTEELAEQAVEETNSPQSSVDFSALSAVSGDVVGWIRISDSRIDYPIAQGDDNVYYLEHLLDGSWNGSGTIFLDYRCPADFSGAHSIIYGHHMQSGSMFAGLVNYKQQAYFEAHPTAFLGTPMGDYSVEFFSGYPVDTESTAWELALDDPESYEEWVEEAISRSVFTSSVRPQPGERILTLATCSYEFENARFVLHGVIR